MEFVKDLRDRASVVQGRCLPYGEGITFWPVAEALKQAAQISDDDPPEEARMKLRALVAGHPDANGIVERVAATLGLAPHSLSLEEGFWGIRKTFETLARKRALVVIFEDIHWGEPAFLDLIDHVVESVEAAPVLLVCPARHELFETRTGWMQGKPNATNLELTVLSAAESEMLIESLLGSSRVSAQLGSRIVLAAEGNPLFMEQIISMWIDEGVLSADHGSRLLVEGTSTRTIPPTLSALLSARLDALSREERTVIAAASVVGDVFDMGAIEHLCPEDIVAQVRQQLTTLTDKVLVRPTTSSFADENAFAFRHTLIRDAAYEGILKKTRADLHERFALWLERKTIDRATEYEEIVGHHLEQSYRHLKMLGRVDERARQVALRAARLLASSGRRAFSRSDISAAVILLDRAHSLFGDDPAGRQLLPDLGNALVDAGEFARAETVLAEALQEAAASHDRKLEAYAVIALGLLQSLAHGKASADIRSEVLQAVSVLENLNDDVGLARAWEMVGLTHSWECHMSAAEQACQRGLEHAERAGARRERSDCLLLLAAATEIGPTPVDRAIERCQEILEMAPGELNVEAMVLSYIARLRAMRGQLVEARATSVRSRRLLEDLGLRLMAAAHSQGSGEIEMLAEDPRAAEREFRRGYTELEAMGEKGFLSTAAGQLANALCSQGRLDEALHFARVSAEAAPQVDPYSQALWSRAKAKVLARRGDFERAQRLARHAVQLLQQTDTLNEYGNALVDLAGVLDLAGRSKESKSVLKTAHSIFEEKGNIVSARKTAQLLIS